MQQMFEEEGFTNFFETSAKKNEGIEDAMNFLVERFSENECIAFNRPVPCWGEESVNLETLNSKKEGSKEKRVCCK